MVNRQAQCLLGLGPVQVIADQRLVRCHQPEVDLGRQTRQRPRQPAVALQLGKGLVRQDGYHLPRPQLVHRFHEGQRRELVELVRDQRPLPALWSHPSGLGSIGEERHHHVAHPYPLVLGHASIRVDEVADHQLARIEEFGNPKGVLVLLQHGRERWRVEVLPHPAQRRFQQVLLLVGVDVRLP